MESWLRLAPREDPLSWRHLPPGLRIGSIASSLGEKHGALAADRESFAVADVCRREKTRFLAVRIIRDAVADQLPPEIEHMSRQKSHAARFGAALGAIVNRPSSLKDMLQVKEDALAYADRLAKFLEGVVVQLVPVSKAESTPSQE